MTNSLVRKEIYGQRIGEGHAPDIHSPNTCPKETLVRVIKAEDGGNGSRGGQKSVSLNWWKLTLRPH